MRRAFYDQVNICEYQIVRNKVVTPLTQEEYKEQIAHLSLNIGEFCLYQDKLMQFKRNIAEVFESLSGSMVFKQQYDALVDKKSKCEEQVRLLSEALKEKRHEKIKLRGLSDYQKQIEICITEQKDTEMILQIISILVKDTEIA